MRSHKTIATPPGTTIREQLEDCEMTQKEFAIRMDMSEKHISQLINGKVHLTHNVALRLELVLGISASFWNNLEARYRAKLYCLREEKKHDSDNSCGGSNGTGRYRVQPHNRDYEAEK